MLLLQGAQKKPNALLPDTFMVESNLFIKEYLIKIILNP